jgi:uncharacterized protein YuzE
MKIEYDKDADALYIQFKNAQVNDNIDIEKELPLTSILTS